MVAQHNGDGDGGEDEHGGDGFPGREETEHDCREETESGGGG